MKEALAKASLAMNEKNFGEAMRLADLVVQEEPAFTEMWVLRGMASAGAQDLPEAKASYEKALSLYRARPENEPQRANNLCQQIFLLSLLGRSDEARALRRTALRQFPDDPGLNSMGEDFASDLAPLALPHD